MNAERDDEKQIMLEIAWIINQESIEAMRLAAERICQIRQQQMSPYMERWTAQLIDAWGEVWAEAGNEWVRRMVQVADCARFTERKEANS